LAAALVSLDKHPFPPGIYYFFAVEVGLFLDFPAFPLIEWIPAPISDVLLTFATSGAMPADRP